MEDNVDDGMARFTICRTRSSNPPLGRHEAVADYVDFTIPCKELADTSHLRFASRSAKQYGAPLSKNKQTAHLVGSRESGSA